MGTDEDWALAEAAIVEACREKGLPAKVEYGEAAFYGPKLDFMIKDAIGRRWQLGTIRGQYEEDTSDDSPCTIRFAGAFLRRAD